MKTFENIKNLIKEENWQELEIVFSSLKSFEETIDGNPEFLYFFQNNIPQAIVLAEKYSLIDQREIIISLRFSSTNFRESLTCSLMKSNTMKPLLFFNNSNLIHLNLIDSNTFNVIFKYYKDNEIKNIYDSDFIKMIFSKKELEKTINTNQNLFTFILNLSDINDFFLFNNYTLNENFTYLNIICSHFKNSIQDLNSNLFIENTKDSILSLHKRIHHPFLPKPHKQVLNIILEDLEKINLFLYLNNKTFEERKNYKYKI